MFIVASYNIHSCVGSDRRFDPQRVAAVIRKLDADIVALQEVDARERDQGFLDQWAYLAQATGYHCVPGISLRTHRNIFGNAVLLREKPQQVRLHDISVTKREPRGAIDLDLVIGDTPVRVVATHLGLRPAEHRMQVKLLLDLLDPAQDYPTMLLGDLNEWRRDTPNIGTLLRAFQPAPAFRTFPARFPLFALDRILPGDGLTQIGHWTHRSSLARLASDHLPICARLALSPAEQRQEQAA